MPRPKDLLSLLDMLGKTESPSAKLRLLGQSWKLLRNLTPRQREHLFAAQGLKQAGSLLRRVDATDERMEEVLESLADQLEKADAAEGLSSLLRRVRQKGVSAVVRDGLDHLKEEVLGSPEPEPASELKIDPQPLDLDSGRPRRPTPTPTSAPPPPPGETPRPPAPEPARRSDRQDTPVEADPAPVPPKPAPRPEPAPQPEAGPVVVEVAKTSVPEPAAPAAVEPPREGSLLSRLAGEERLIDRFRMIRNHLTELAGPGDLDQAVEQFPPGWARRRLVTQLIREAEVSFESACSLLEKLPGPAEHWAVSAILERYPIDRARRERLLETVKTPLSRRRIERHAS